MPTVTVSVGSDASISCDPDTCDVGKTNGNVVIKWKMDNDATSKLYEITAVTFPNGGTEFIDPGKDQGDGWKITDKNTLVGDYSYEVTVALKSTGEKTNHDPVVRNGGRNQQV